MRSESQTLYSRGDGRKARLNLSHRKRETNKSRSRNDLFWLIPLCSTNGKRILDLGSMSHRGPTSMKSVSFREVGWVRIAGSLGSHSVQVRTAKESRFLHPLTLGVAM